jgi:hypothetical protein
MSAKREWHGCTNPAGHKFEEGLCEDCGMDLRLVGERIEALGKSVGQAVEATLRQELGLAWARNMSLERKVHVLESELRELRKQPKPA